MTQDENALIYILGITPDTNVRAIFVQTYISERGPLGEEAGARVRELLRAVQD